MTSMRVERTGPRTTVQDLGRPGYGHVGVPLAGAADRGALRRANRLVGNMESAAALETTFGGLVVRIASAGEVTITCVGSTLVVEDAEHEGPARVSDGAIVRVGTPERGVYSYLAVAGGIEVPPVLGSRSTDTLSGLGPAVVRPGDELPVGQPAQAPQTIDAVASTDDPLRVVLGPRDDWFTESAIRQLLDSEWTVQPDSDRIGVRLGGSVLERRVTRELPSEGMIAGAIQVPPGGQPIVFVANHPTTGGYPVIAVILTGDVDRASQMRPGAQLRFRL